MPRIVFIIRLLLLKEPASSENGGESTINMKRYKSLQCESSLTDADACVMGGAAEIGGRSEWKERVVALWRKYWPKSKTEQT